MVCYWKGLVTQADLFAKTCKKCQQFQERKIIYVHLPPNNITELKMWESVHEDLIGSYRKSIRQQHPGGTVIQNNVSLTYMTMIDLATGRFQIIEIPTFDLEEATLCND